MKKLFLTVFILMLIGTSYGQVRASSQNPFWELKIRWIELNEANIAMGEAPNSLENIEGSAYVPENFISGKIYINGEVMQDNVFLRYNKINDEIEIKNSLYDNASNNAVVKDPEIYARVGNTTYVFAPYKGSIDDGGYFALVASGENYDLYKRATATFIPFKTATPYVKEQSAKFRTTEKYYLVTKKGNFFDLPTKKNKILKVMDDHQEEIKNLIKSKSLDLDNEAHLIKVFNIYNDLVTAKTQ